MAAAAPPVIDTVGRSGRIWDEFLLYTMALTQHPVHWTRNGASNCLLFSSTQAPNPNQGLLEMQLLGAPMPVCARSSLRAD